LPKPDDSPVSIAVAPLPSEKSGRADELGESEMQTVQDIIGAVRSIRSERDVHPRTRIDIELRSDSEAIRTVLEQEQEAVITLAKVDKLSVADVGGERPAGTALTSAGGIEVLVMLKGVVDAGKERERVEREVRKTEKDIAAITKKLSSKGFAERAPAEVVNEARENLEASKRRLIVLEEARKLAAEL